MKNKCLKIEKLDHIKDMVKVKFLEADIIMFISEVIFKEKVRNRFWILESERFKIK